MLLVHYSFNIHLITRSANNPDVYDIITNSCNDGYPIIIIIDYNPHYLGYDVRWVLMIFFIHMVMDV
jgi:hypothetical protein